MKTKTYVVGFLALCVGVPSALVVFLVGYAALAKYGFITSDTAKRLAASIKADQEPPTWQEDLHVNASCVTGGPAATWVVNVRNSSKTESYRDLSYRTEYYAESGTSVGRGGGKFLIVLRPGEDRRLPEVSDGFMPPQARSCRIRLDGAFAAD